MARFSCISDEELSQILDGKDSANTKKSTNTLFNVLRSYCVEKSIDFNPETITKNSLNDILLKFYVEVQKADGSLYKKTLFYAIRFAIQRKFKEVRGNDFNLNASDDGDENFDNAASISRSEGGIILTRSSVSLYSATTSSYSYSYSTTK